MAKNHVRVELKEFEDTLQNAINAIKYDSIKNEYAEIKYDFISSMINFIKQNTDHIQSNTLKSLILLIGASGAGKSTLLNYLYSPDNLVVSKNEGKLEVKDKDTSFAEIGNGKGSTTLFPNVWSSSFGTFLDCPGEGDTRGIIAEVVDSIFKSKVSSNVEQVKILFVAPQASLGSEGSYGMSFKHALDKNAQFLRDIQHFKNSMAFVISSAGVRKTALENSVELINIILNEHANLSAYKDTVSHVISSKNIVTFSKPSEDSDFGDPYFPPSWNPNQREKIIEMIQKLPFTSIPHKNFFNISTSANVREAMSESLKIVEMKAGLLLKDLVEKASPFTIFAVELKPFVKYLGDLMNGCNTTLSNYIKILAWNNYLKITPDKELINKLNEEIIFLSQFTKGLNEDKNQVIEQDWTKTADLIEILTTTYNNTCSIISCPGNNFLKWVTQGNVTVKPSSSYANEILTNFKSLNKNYKKQKEIDLLGKDQNSTYFDTKTIQVFSHNKAVPYKEKVPYETTEYYEEEEYYYVTEERTVQKTNYRPVTKIKEEAYTELTPVTQYKEEQYEVEVPSTARSVTLGILTLGITALARGGQFTDTVIKTRKVPHTEYIPTEKTRQVIYQDVESYEEDVIKHTPVAKTRTVTKSRPIIKEKEVEKIRQEPVYKDEVIKELNSEKHDEDTKGIDNVISKYRELIVDSINRYPKAKKLGDHNKDAIISIDEFDKKYEDLQKLWQEAEYEAYFAQNPNNSLSEEFDIQTIGNLVEDIS